MNKKAYIQYVIIALGFIGSGIVLYKGFNPSSGTANLPSTSLATLGVSSGLGGATASSTTANNGVVLPNGKSFNLSSLNQHHLQYDLVPEPVLDTSTDVGVDENSLIQPLSSGTGQ